MGVSHRTALAADQPLYHHVYRAIAEEIANGALQPGDRLPVERSLCERFNVSRATVRRALAALAEDGLIETSLRRGSFVMSGPLSEPPNVLLSFAAMAASRGFSVSSEVLVNRIRSATIDEADALRVVPGTPLFELERLRLLEGMPVSIELDRIPLTRADGIDKVDYRVASLYQTFEERCGVIPTRADFTVEAVAATETQAPLLAVDVGALLLLTRDITFGDKGEPISLGRTYYRSDRYRFRATVYRRPNPAAMGKLR